MKVTILINPIGKQRPRFRQQEDGRVVTYTPRETRESEGVIKYIIRSAMSKLPVFGPDTPIMVDMIFYRLRPRSLPKRVKHPITRPDWDNLGKLVSDAVEKYLFANDGQLTDVRIRKRFGDPPRIVLTLEEDNGGEEIK